MKYRKIHIVGGAGSGKTYIAKILSERYDIPTYELDEIFWTRSANDYGARSSESDRDNALVEILKNDTWIIEGAYYRWLAQSFQEAELIVILMPSVWVRHKRILMRFIKRKLGLIEGRKESLSDFMELVKWNHKFDKDNIVRIREFISQHKAKTVVCKGLHDILIKVKTHNNAMQTDAHTSRR